MIKLARRRPPLQLRVIAIVGQAHRLPVYQDRQAMRLLYKSPRLDLILSRIPGPEPGRGPRRFSNVADYRLWLGDANDTAGKTATCVPGGLRFQIIGLFMDDNCVTNDRISAGEFHHFVTPLEMSLARRVCFNVTQIAGVTIRRIWGAVRFMHRIKMTPGRTSIARGAITKFVDVETVFAWRETSDISDHFYFLPRSGEVN